MQLAGTRGLPRVMDWRLPAAVAGAITAIAAVLALLYRAARGMSKREEAVELVPKVAEEVAKLADRLDDVVQKLDNVANAAIMVPTLKEQMQAHDHKLDGAAQSIGRIEHNQERLSNDVRAVEGNLAAVGKDVAEARRDIDWLKKRANGVTHPGGEH